MSVDRLKLCPKCDEFKPYIAFGRRKDGKLKAVCKVCENGGKVRQLVERHCIRAAEIGLPATLTVFDWFECLDYWGFSCAYCGSTRLLQLDHYIPLSHKKCPGTVPENVLPACQRCNTLKGKTHPEAWIHEYYEVRYGNNLIAKIQAYFSGVQK